MVSAATAWVKAVALRQSVFSQISASTAASPSTSTISPSLTAAST